MNRSWSRTLIVALLHWLDYKTLQLLFSASLKYTKSSHGGLGQYSALGNIADHITPVDQIQTVLHHFDTNKEENTTSTLVHISLS